MEQAYSSDRLYRLLQRYSKDMRDRDTTLTYGFGEGNGEILFTADATIKSTGVTKSYPFVRIYLHLLLKYDLVDELSGDLE